ncbi:MAG: enoyl-CoA hydratase [Alphaproteobacteria bacterium]|nr:enoyl-CoA hydratase [Alphaproteobacteria bacterium]
MTPSESIVLNVAQGLAHVRLNRPSVLNSFDEGMAKTFSTLMQAIEARSDIRAVVISGEGRGFCAGGDIAAFGSDPQAIASVDRLITDLHHGVEILSRLACPTIAIVHGAVAGAGFSLALSCDFIVAAENAKFTLAYSKLGATPDGGSSWSLPRLVGVRKALEIALLSDVLTAEDALQMNLISRIAPIETFMADGLALAERLANGATQALGRAKHLILSSYGRSFSQHLDAERDAFLSSLTTHDFAEGKAAFLGKRQPKFEGK